MDQVSVVPYGDVSALGELEGRVDGHLLAGGLAEGLCPGELAGVSLHLEVLVALGAAKAKLFCIVANECDALAWVGGPATEVASLDSDHFEYVATSGSAVILLVGLCGRAMSSERNAVVRREGCWVLLPLTDYRLSKSKNFGRTLQNGQAQVGRKRSGLFIFIWAL